MTNQKARRVHRSAVQWARLVKAWKKSGETATSFAKPRGISPRTLTWWSWRLAERADAKDQGERSKMRLVGVEVQPRLASAGLPMWELASADGHVLRVYQDTPCTELVPIVQVMMSGSGR